MIKKARELVHHSAAKWPLELPVFRTRIVTGCDARGQPIRSSGKWRCIPSCRRGLRLPMLRSRLVVIPAEHMAVPAVCEHKNTKRLFPIGDWVVAVSRVYRIMTSPAHEGTV